MTGSHAIPVDLSWMSEEEFPIRCVDCEYLLTGLGDSERCPQCSRSFDRAERLVATYRNEIELHDLGLDESFDLSRIPESSWPITCEDCQYCLTGLGEAGRCPECGKTFDRRRRLWDMHGPEAFASIEPDPAEMASRGFFRNAGGIWYAMVACSICTAYWLLRIEEPSIIETILFAVVIVLGSILLLSKSAK